MASKERISLVLQLDNGVDENGKPVLKRKTFSNVNLKATDDALLNGARSLGKLFENPTRGIQKIEVVNLGGEA